jgi:hypothetical protein
LFAIGDAKVKCQTIILLLLLGSALCVGGCRKSRDGDVIGTWVCRTKPSGAGADANEATVKLLADATFTVVNMPVENLRGNVEFWTGSGTWRVDTKSDRVQLDFLRIGDKDRKYGEVLLIVRQPPLGEISLCS